MDGPEIKALRKKHGMTQKQMAELLGVNTARVASLERGRPMREAEEARLSEWSGDGGEPAPDDLPEPPYDPDRAPPVDEDEEEGREAPKRRRRPAPRKRGGLSAWQEETAIRLTALVQGERVAIEVNGQVTEIVIPGLCALIAVADPFDAAVVGQGCPAFFVALVKVAPRHPWLKAILDALSMGGDYNELARASMAIAIPIMIHHGMIPMPRPVVPAAVENGQPEEPGA